MMQLYHGSGGCLSDKPNAIASIQLEYGRYEGAGYCLARIPKYSVDGKRILPSVSLTAGENGAAVSTLTYAQRENPVFTLNAGLFNTSTMSPQGQTIVRGISVTNSPMTDDMGAAISDAECYPLCMDRQGDLSAPYGRTEDTARMLRDGVWHAVTGWGVLVDNFLPTGTDKFDEIVHVGKYIRQSIGQFGNGDYMVCTVDMEKNGQATNGGGMAYETLAALLVSKGVKFAYALDGGGSCETVIGKRQINPIYEGTAGRAVPTVIRFDVQP